jgi:hypothetical protein
MMSNQDGMKRALGGMDNQEPIARTAGQKNNQEPGTSDDPARLYASLMSLLVKDDPEEENPLFSRALRALPKLPAPEAAMLIGAVMVLQVYIAEVTKRFTEDEPLIIRSKAAKTIKALCELAERI